MHSRRKRWATHVVAIGREEKYIQNSDGKAIRREQ
jgi:hypothetical protein